MNYSSLINELLNESGKTCVTLTFPTHKTFPDNHRDPVILRSLINEVDKKIKLTCELNEAQKILTRLEIEASSINHNLNSEGLAVFANKDFSKCIKFPFYVSEKIVIDKSFEIKDLIYKEITENKFYVLSLTSEKILLFEGFKNKLELIENVFHIFQKHENQEFYNLNKNKEIPNLEHYIKFDNEISKKIYQNNNSVIITGKSSNIGNFLRISKNLKSIYIKVKDYSESNLITFGNEIWEIVQKLMEQKRIQQTTLIEEAQKVNKVIYDINQISQKSDEGKGELLFVDEKYSMPFNVEKEDFKLKDNVIQTIIENVIKNGGEVVFLPTDSLIKYNNLVLIERY